VSTLSRIRLAGQHLIRDLLARPSTNPRDLRRHQSAAVDWLCRAQDATDDGGVAASFHLLHGWLPSYPETTGYIACTFFDLARQPPHAHLAARAWRMIEWLLGCQYPDGGFPGHFGDLAHPPIVFNTGQILLGLVRAAESDPAHRDLHRSIARAAAWLTAVQDDDGCWRRCTHAGVVHTYNTRTAFALLRAGRLLDDDRFLAAGMRNLRWALAQQRDDGWFEHAGFWPDVPPYLHTIAYTIDGLMEAGLLLKADELCEAARAAAEPLARELVLTDKLAGAYDRGWRAAGHYRCLTGEAQMAIVWARLSARTGRALFREAAERVVRRLAATQHLAGPPEVRGAIAGSCPIWGEYARLEFPNWAAKFFVDAVAALEAIGGAGLKPTEAPECV